MEQLAIKGHLTRGREVIALLEMLGGNNIHNYGGTFNECYIIDNNKICTIYTSVAKIDNCTIFTLEEFEEKFPYKVGDKVSIPEYESEVYIAKMKWNGFEIMYCVNTCYGDEWFTSQDLKDFNEKYLQPYKEQDNNMKENEDLKHCGTATIKYIQEKGSRDMELIIPYNQEIVIENGRYILRDKKPKYPKTYIECAKILNCFITSYIDGYKNELLENLQALLICRDAYWKIAGEQMGLGKSWEPDWSNGELKWCMSYSGYCIEFDQYKSKHHVLTFPTEEMRDAFYENFKDLIENVKELL